APVIEEAAAVEHDALDPFFDRPFGDHLADRFGALDVAAAHRLVELTFQRRLDRRGGDERLTGQVVNHLRVDMSDAAEHAEPRPIFGAGNPLALPQLDPHPAVVSRFDLHRFTTESSLRPRLA